MLIGIDASRALNAKRTGTERYSLEIIRHLLQTPNAARHRFRLYLHQPVDAALFAPPGTRTTAPWEPCLLPSVRAWSHRRLGPEVRTRRPDLLFVPAHVLPVALLGRPLPPSVVTIHDVGYLDFPASHATGERLYLDWSTRAAVRRATHLIAVSEATRRDLITLLHAPEERVSVVHEAGAPLPPCSPEEIASVQARYGLQRPYALYVGTLRPRKNLVRLVQAYARLHERAAQSPGPPFDLVLAGAPGHDSDDLLRAVRSAALPGRIHLTGYLSEADLPPLLRGARLFCYPSLVEGFGLPILEAQSAGVPVVTTTNSSLPEVAGDAALLVEPTDVDALADAMLRVSRDEPLRQRLIAAGYENVKRFSWAKAARETLAVLEEAARAGRKPGARPTPPPTETEEP